MLSVFYLLTASVALVKNSNAVSLFHLADKCDCEAALARTKWSVENLGCLFKIPLKRNSMREAISQKLNENAPCILLESKKEYCKELVDLENFNCHVVPYKVIKNLIEVKRMFDRLFLNETDSEEFKDTARQNEFDFENTNDSEFNNTLTKDDLDFVSEFIITEKDVTKNSEENNINKNEKTSEEKLKNIDENNDDAKLKAKETLHYMKTVINGAISIIEDIGDFNQHAFSIFINNSDTKDLYQTVVYADLKAKEMGLIQVEKDELQSMIKGIDGKSIFVDGDKFILDFDQENIKKYNKEKKLELLSIRNDLDIVTNNNEQEIISYLKENLIPKVELNRKDMPMIKMLADNNKDTIGNKKRAKTQIKPTTDSLEEDEEVEGQGTEPSAEEEQTASAEENTDDPTTNSTATNLEDDETNTTSVITMDVSNTTIPVTVTPTSTSANNSNATQSSPTNITDSVTNSTNCTTTTPCGCDACNTVIFTFPTEAPPEPQCSTMRKVWNYCVNYIVPAVAITVSAVAVLTFFVGFL